MLCHGEQRKEGLIFLLEISQYVMKWLWLRAGLMSCFVQLLLFVLWAQIDHDSQGQMDESLMVTPAVEVTGIY